MKKYIITVLFFGCIIGQFRTGTISAGSLFHYSNYSQNDGNSNGDYYALGTTSMRLSTFSAKPTINYFILPFVSIDAIIDYTSRIDTDTKDTYTMQGIGMGVSYYFNQFIYIGAGLFKASSKSESPNYDSSTIESYTSISGGYLLPLNAYVSIDFNCNYLIGQTIEQDYNDNWGNYNYSDSSSRGLDDTIFNFNVGIKAFF